MNPITSGQSQLFFESIFDALRSIADHCGGPKVVGPELWRNKNPDDARISLLNALNPDRSEKLSLEQVIRLFQLGRECGYHAGKHWFDEACGYTFSMPADPVEQEHEQLRVVKDAAEALRRALDTIERLEQKKLEPALRTVRAHK